MRYWPSARERIERRIERIPWSGCWIWTGYLNSCGYGVSSHKHKPILAHRLSWEVMKGQIPDGLRVLHKCDIPSCVNPEHLFLGTMKDNSQDAIKKGRFVFVKSKLSDSDVKEIRSSPLSRKEIAEKFKIHPMYVSNLRSHRYRKEI